MPPQSFTCSPGGRTLAGSLLGLAALAAGAGSLRADRADNSGGSSSPQLSFADRQEVKRQSRMLPVTSNIQFDSLGYRWFVKDSGGQKRLPGPCVWSGDSRRVWQDGQGIHLTVQPQDGGCGGYASTEVWATRPLGYGNYLFRISGPFNTMDPEVTFGLFLWDDDCPGACHFREIDFELARWGNEGDPNAGQWVVQPWTVPGNLKRFNINKAKNFGGQNGPKGGGSCADPGPEGFGGAQWQQLTLLMQWFPGGLLRFYVFDGHHNLGNVLQAKGSLLSSWEFPHKERVPRPGDERVHFNLWQANWGGVPRRNRRVHVVVNGMEHSPQWMDLPAHGIYPAGGRLLSWTRSLAGESAAPVETAERLKPTPKPKPEPPAGAAKGAAAPAGVDANLAKYPQVLGDYETALQFYNPHAADKESDASTSVGSDTRLLQAATSEAGVDGEMDAYAGEDVFLPGVPTPPNLPQTDEPPVSAPPPPATSTDTSAGSPSTGSWWWSSSDSGPTSSDSPSSSGSGSGSVPTVSTPTGTPTTLNPDAAAQARAPSAGTSKDEDDTTVGASAGGTRGGGGANSVPEKAGESTNKGTTIALAVMGSALAAVGVAAAGVAVRRKMRGNDSILGGTEGGFQGATAPRALKRSAAMSGSSGTHGGGSHESADTATYGSWREAWSAATPDFLAGGAQTGFAAPAGGAGSGTQASSSSSAAAPAMFTGTSSSTQGGAAVTASEGAPSAKASGTSPHRTAARHRTASQGGYYDEGPAQAVANGHHVRPAQAATPGLRIAHNQ